MYTGQRLEAINKESDMKGKVIKAAFLDNGYYTQAQIDRLCGAMRRDNSFSAKLVVDAGLRAMELATLYLDGDTFKVIGKSGLHRTVRFSDDNCRELLNRKREIPIEVVDRGAKYVSHFELSYGVKFSSAVTKASKRCLGWSIGAKGLRDTWAIRRFEQLSWEYPHDTALKIVKFELGEVATGLHDLSYTSIEDILNEK